MPTPILLFYLACLKYLLLLFWMSLHYAIWFKSNPSFENCDVNKDYTDAGSALNLLSLSLIVNNMELRWPLLHLVIKKWMEFVNEPDNVFETLLLLLWYMPMLVMNVCPSLLNTLGRSMFAFPSIIYKKMEFLWVLTSYFLVPNLAFAVSECCSVCTSSMLITAKIWILGLS